MNKILLGLLLLFMVSCNDDNVKYSCTKGTIRILNKDKQACARGGGYCYYRFYLYDGTKAYWCQTDIKTYDMFNINDTLPTLVITKTIKDE